jgi:hypothetical protein
MGNCNMDCCRCIDKKETQINQMPSISKKLSKCHKNKLNQIRPIEFSQILILQTNNKDNANDEKTSLYTLENEKITGRKKYNNNTLSDINGDILLKYSKKNQKGKYYSPNNRYDNTFETLKSKTKEMEKEQSSNEITIKKENNNDNNFNKEKEVKMKDVKFQNITPRYLHTDFKTDKNNVYSRYFDEIGKDKNKLQLNGNNKKRISNNENTFPKRYSNLKDKYITYFTDENI